MLPFRIGRLTLKPESVRMIGAAQRQPRHQPDSTHAGNSRGALAHLPEEFNHRVSAVLDGLGLTIDTAVTRVPSSSLNWPTGFAQKRGASGRQYKPGCRASSTRCTSPRLGHGRQARRIPGGRRPARTRDTSLRAIQPSNIRTSGRFNRPFIGERSLQEHVQQVPGRPGSRLVASLKKPWTSMRCSSTYNPARRSAFSGSVMPRISRCHVMRVRGSQPPAHATPPASPPPPATGAARFARSARTVPDRRRDGGCHARAPSETPSAALRQA